MPSYDYKCKKCNKVVTIDKSMAEASREEVCPDCNETMQRIFTPVGNKWRCSGAYDGKLK